MTYEDWWTPQDINKMSMEEYTKYREHILGHLDGRGLDELREMETIPKPPPPFHFESF